MHGGIAAVRAEELDRNSREAARAPDVRLGADTAERVAECAPLSDTLDPVAISIWRDQQASAEDSFLSSG